MATISWTFDPNHCNIRFVARHLFISEVEGTFGSFNGAVTSDNDELENANVFFEIDVSSIKTSSEIRDNNLRSENFFDVTNYPKISFRTVSFQRTLGQLYTLRGELTIKNVTKSIDLEVQLNGCIIDPDGKEKAGLKVRGSLNRFDYNINFNRMVNSIIDVGSDISFVCNIELFKK